jgi:hypothetical protein
VQEIEAKPRRLRVKPESERNDDYGKLRQLLAKKVEELVQSAVSEAVAPLLEQLQVLMAQVQAQDATIRQMQILGRRSQLAEHWHSDSTGGFLNPRLKITSSGTTLSAGDTPEAAYLQGLQHALDEYQIRTADLTEVPFWNKAIPKAVGGIIPADNSFRAERYGGILEGHSFDDSAFSDDDIDRLINDLSRDADDGLSFTES